MSVFPSALLALGLLLLPHQVLSFSSSVTAPPSIVPKTNREQLDVPSPPLSQVQIYDGVFPKAVCDELDLLAIDHLERSGEGSSIFRRDELATKTPLEVALDSVLTALGDPNPIVEYWSRQEYLNLDAHADLDEEELEEDGTLRYPQFAHVLYLRKDDDIRLHAPTCVFPTMLGGWMAAGDNQYKNNTMALVTVPAVEGRVLRFPGSALHAVPRPATRWCMSPQDQSKLDDDLEMSVDEDPERSVILFNTWSERGPRGVTPDFATGVMPDGIALDDDDDDDDELTAPGPPVWQMEEWKDEFGCDMKDMLCQPRAQWTQTTARSTMDTSNGSCTQNNDASTSTFHVKLMGGEERRLFSQRYATMQANPLELQKALLEDSRPSCVPVYCRL